MRDDGFAVASLIARLRLSLAHFNSEEATAEEHYLMWSQIVTTSCRCQDVTGMLPECCRNVAGKLRDIARTFAKFWIETLF